MKPERWSKIESIFHKALAADESRRGSVIEESCAGDEELRREVESLLAHHSDSASFIEQPAFAGQVTTGSVGPVTAADAPRPDLKGVAVGHYRILEEIGSGGMGVVYKAEDARLGRLVALKFLPERIAADSVALERFRREARSASSLNHPNICTIYDIDLYQGREFIVMEYLDGQTLAMYMAGRRVVGNELVAKLGMAIAEAVSAAHSKGIIHRDIKPGNIFVTESGLVKVLDFGVAKLAAESNQPDATTLTETNAVTGTLPYMSPEQLRGENLDARSDIYALGVVLYEIATGQRLYSSSLPARLVDEILNRPASPPSNVNRKLSAKADDIILKCLAKDPEDRYQTAKEIAVDLRHLGTQATSGAVSVGTGSVRTGRKAWPWLLAAAAFTVTLLVLLLVSLSRSRGPTTRLELVQRQLTANSPDNPVLAAAISPDGKFLAYSDTNGLHLQLISTGETRQLTLPSGLAVASAFSGAPATMGAPLSWFPDGSKVLITAVTHPWGTPSVWAVSILGGAARKLREGATAGSFSPDGSQIAFLGDYDSGPAKGIWLSTADGNDPRRILAAQPGENFNEVAWAPDGQRLAYTKVLAGTGYVSAIESVSLKGGPPTRILSSPKLQGFCWLPDGRIVYSLRQSVQIGADSDLWEVRTITQTGEPTGHPRQLTNWPGFSFSGFTVTADGKQMEFLRFTTRAHVYVGDLDAKGTHVNNTRRLTFDEHFEWPQWWTPDSRAAVFWSDRDGSWDIFKQTLDKDDTAELLPLGPELKWNSSFSPDGHWILYMALPEARYPGGSVPVRIMRVPVSGGPPQLVLTAFGTTDIRCTRAPANLCVFDEQQQGHTMFTSVDPMKGRGRAFATMEGEPTVTGGWDLSPDGSQVVVTRKGRIRLLSLKSGVTTDLAVRGWNSFWSVDWSADGNALFVSCQTPQDTTLLRVDLRGEASALWHQKLNFVGTKGIPSPDGRHLAVAGWTTDSNVWMIENF
jgi:eukaryotic-like serine/threonine-protein kinase